MPEPSGAGARVGGLADPVQSRPKGGYTNLVHCYPCCFQTSEHYRVFFFSTWFCYGFERRETRWPASKEEILEEMVAKSLDIDFLKSDKTSLAELATFLSEDEHEEGESSMARVADKVPLAGRTKSVTSTDVDSPD
jgi:hypothetical protein